MGWKFCSAAGCSVDCLRKPFVLRSVLLSPGVNNSNEQDHRKVLKRHIFMSTMPDLSGHAFPAGEDLSPAQEEADNVEPITNLVKPQQVRRRCQQQKLLWRSPSSAEETQSTGNSQPSVPAATTRRHAQRSRRQQQQELLWGGPPSDDHPLLPQQQPVLLDPSGEVTLQEENVGSLEDILAQRNEALLMRSGRRRNRMPIISVQEQAPDVTMDVSLLGSGPQVDKLQNAVGLGHDRNDSNADSMSISAQRQDKEGSQQLHPHRQQSSEQQVPSALFGMMRPQPPNTTSALESQIDGAGDQVITMADSATSDAGSSGSYGMSLRLRRYGYDTAARRRIRLPLQQRPKPWPVNVLLGAEHLEQQRQGQKPYEGQAKERDQQGLNSEDVTGGMAVTAGQPPGVLQKEGELGAQGNQWAGGRGLGLEKVQYRRDVSLVGQELQQSQALDIHVHVDEHLERIEGKRNAQVQFPNLLSEKSIPQFRSNHKQKSEHEQTLQQQHELKTQQNEDRKHKRKVRKALTEANQSQVNAKNSKLGFTGRLRVQGSCCRVAAHPDGTLWSYRAKDVEPLAARMLKQLLKPSGAVVGNVPREEPVGPQDHDFTLSNFGPGANGGADGDVTDASNSITIAANNLDPESISSGVCHILAAGSHQSYNLVRALSYVQGALQVAGYNGHITRMSSANGSSSAVTAAGPALGIIVTGISLPKLRMYYEQTVSYTSTPKPELGPSPPPSRVYAEGDIVTSGKRVVTPYASNDVATGPEVALPADTQQFPSDHAGALGPAVCEKIGTRPGTTHVSRQPLRPMPLQGWPDDAAQIYPRALVSAYLVQPPAALMHGVAAVSASRVGGNLPPVAVSASADVHALARLLVARLHICGYCRIQALGRSAVSHTLRIMSVAGWILSRAGLGVLAFPHMRPRGAEPRADLPLSLQRAAGRPPTAAAAVPSTMVAAAAATLDPVLLDKAPQLVLDLIPCGWNERGRPVVAERLGPLVAPTAVPGALSTAGVMDGRDSKHGAGCNPGPEQLDKELARNTAQSATDRGNGRGRSSPVRLRAPITQATTSVKLSLGGPDGGPDTRTTTAAVARGIADGLRVVLTARGLGSLLRLPVVMFRAQGALVELVRPQRRALMFTLRNAVVDLDKTSGWENLQASASKSPECQLQSQQFERSGIQQQEQQEQQEQQQQYAGEVLQSIQLTATDLQAKTEAKVIGKWAVAESLAAEVFQVPVSALQHHLDSLPRYQSEGINASSAHRRLAASNHKRRREDTGGEDKEGVSSRGSPNQQFVEAAAAAATEHLLQYGMAVLVGTSPGSRLTALLATACVSEGLMCSAGLTVLVRVDPTVMPQRVFHMQTRAQLQHSNAKPVSTLRPLPPKRYQLLLSRFDPRIGVLQLLGPDDLANAGLGVADA